MTSGTATEKAGATADEADWFGRFLRNSVDTIAVVAYLAELLQSSLIAADEASCGELTTRLDGKGDTSRIVRQQFLPLVLSKDLTIRRIIIVDTQDEEVARARLRQALTDAKFPQSIVEGLELVTFFADLLPAMIARRPAESLAFEPLAALAGARLYVIVSTPRAGSTYLGDLLQSIGLGNPIEHMRPWVIDLFASRPPGLFDTIRFAQRLIAFGRSGSVFGTKLISHITKDLQQALTPAELSYVSELASRTRFIYLNRRNKLDQAISSLRAHKTGIWHSTDKAYQTVGQYEAFAYDFDEIARTLGYYVNEERRLAALLAECPDLIVVDYDELSMAPAPLCRTIAERLGVTAPHEPTAKVEKLADDASKALTSRFLNEARERGVAITQFLDAEELLHAARSEAAERQEEAERIRRGHARHRGGPYQDRHYHLIDYDCAPVPGLPDSCRGPVPKSLLPGQYVLFLGAAQTYGAFAARPFPTQIGERLMVDILNLGKGGVSPLFFSENPRYRELIAGARAVVVQAMSARMVPTSRFASLGYMNLLYMRDDPLKTTVDSAVMWEKLRTTEPPETLHALVAEARAEWVKSMISIARCAAGPTVLLWFSERSPDYQITFDSNFGVFNRFPQLVDTASIEAVKPHYSAYVDVVTPPHTEGEPTRSAFSNIVLPVVFGGGRLEEQTLQTANHYYPTQAMHDHAADALAAVLQNILAGTPP